MLYSSAGIGRTGTFIALDYMLDEGGTENYVDVKSYVTSLRQQRGKSIQTYVGFLFYQSYLKSVCLSVCLDLNFQTIFSALLIPFLHLLGTVRISSRSIDWRFPNVTTALLIDIVRQSSIIRHGFWHILYMCFIICCNTKLHVSLNNCFFVDLFKCILS